MKAFLETTEWSAEFAMPNHVYFLSDSKDKMYGYVKASTGEIQEMGQPYRFKAGGRKFKEVRNVWGFAPRQQLTPEPDKFKVTGSRGDVYTVTEELGVWSCTCPASKYQAGDCKHIKSVQSN
jgi:hypothetical protein